ncbi:MAG: hypothetical protein S4CHLAM7_10000 [Chlamydiae bacterium]|nr:hypothetical protein [Chlamydiota bacterium]
MTLFRNLLKTSTFFVSLLFVALSTLGAEAEQTINLQNENQPNLQAQSSSNNSTSCRNFYFTSRSNIGKTPTYFYNTSLGLGLLYFSGQKGSDAYTSLHELLKTSTPNYQGGTGYNRTPLIDATLGWNPWSWMGLGISYVGQHNVIFERNLWSSSNVNTGKIAYYFRANVDLNAFVAKTYFYSPYTFVCKSLALSQFISFAVGPAWQTWTPSLLSIDTGTCAYFRQKISANCFFMTDLGFQLKSTEPSINFSMLFGIKFNIWGQARSMGALNQQRIRQAGNTPENDNVSLQQPFSIRTVYQFAPYIGVMWSY